MTNVMILCRRKARNNSSHRLQQELEALGLNVYRATANVTPARRPEWADVIVNYGVSTVPVWNDRIRPDAKRLNSPSTVYISANKRRTAEALEDKGVAQIETTTRKDVASRWCEEGHTVVSRTRLGACRGIGIVLSPPDPLPDCNLYTKLMTGDGVREYRVYIVGGKAIDITQKKRYTRARLEEAGIDRTDPYTKLIRTNGNGWVFARNTIDASDSVLNGVRALAEECAEAIDLGMGAVDIIALPDENGELLEARVIEPNTSVSLVGDRTTRRIMAAAVAKEVA